MPSNEGQVPGPENRGLSTRPGSSTDTLALIDYRQLWVLGIHVSVLPSNCKYLMYYSYSMACRGVDDITRYYLLMF